MDGERFQLHMRDGVYKYLSRNGIDYTANFGKCENEGILTPILSKHLNSSVKSLILDGEMMVWNQQKKCFCVKGENYDVKHLRAQGNLKPCFVVFDILYLNNESYLETPYVDRIRKIEENLRFQIGVIQSCKKMVVHNLEEFVAKFNEAMNANEEGVVLKHPNSSYKPGIRGAGWYKLKPDYVNDVIADLCFVVMGVLFDRSNNYISSYLLGAILENKDDPSLSEIYSVSTVNSGLSNPARQQLNSQIMRSLVKEKPENFLIGKLTADSWLPLNQTVLMDVTASELHRSEDYKTDYSLRFPRILCVRTDKVWLEATTVQELSSAISENERVKKIYKRNLDVKDFSAAKRMKLLAENPYKVDVNLDAVERISTALAKTEFCILSGSVDNKYSTESLKQIVAQHGGKVVENPSVRSSCICIAGKIGFKAKKLCESGKYNIIKPDWLIRNFCGKKAVQFSRPKPRDIIFATDQMKEKQTKYFDKYGDSYTEPVDEDELKVLFDGIEEPTLISDQEFLDLQLELETHWEKQNKKIVTI